MGRPETISCERCGASVTVNNKGPVPSYCPDCRRKRSRHGQARPEFVSCERCSEKIPVRARGPLPRFCRDGCPPPEVALDQTSAPVRSTSDQPASVLRPWHPTPERTPSPAIRTPQTAGRHEPRPRGAAATLEPTITFTPTVTRFDTMHPDSLVGSAQLDRALRTRRLRRAAAIIAWLAIVAIIVLIVFVGGRPAPTGFQS